MAVWKCSTRTRSSREGLQKRAQSPAAYTSGALVRPVASTRMPPSQTRPAASASSTLGCEPIAVQQANGPGLDVDLDHLHPPSQLGLGRRKHQLLAFDLAQEVALGERRPLVRRILLTAQEQHMVGEAGSAETVHGSVRRDA